MINVGDQVRWDAPDGPNLRDNEGREVIRQTKDREACTVTGECGLEPGHEHRGVKSERRGRIACIDEHDQVHVRDQFGESWIVPIGGVKKMGETDGKRRGRIGRSRSAVRGGGF